MEDDDQEAELVYEIHNLPDIINQASTDDWGEMWRCMRCTVEDVIWSDQEGDDGAEVFLAALTAFAVRYQRIINRICEVADVDLIEYE